MPDCCSVPFAAHREADARRHLPAVTLALHIAIEETALHIFRFRADQGGRAGKQRSPVPRASFCTCPRDARGRARGGSTPGGSYHENFKCLEQGTGVLVPSSKVGRLVGRKEKFGSISAEKSGTRLASPQPRPRIAGQWGRGDNRLLKRRAGLWIVPAGSCLFSDFFTATFCVSNG
jgi:hypothetical protein